MSGKIGPFIPSYGSNNSITLVAATPQIIPLVANAQTVRISNTGATNPAYAIAYSLVNGAQVASATRGVYLPPNSMIMITKAVGADSLSIVSALGTTAEIMCGECGY